MKFKGTMDIKILIYLTPFKNWSCSLLGVIADGFETPEDAARYAAYVIKRDFEIDRIRKENKL